MRPAGHGEERGPLMSKLVSELNYPPAEHDTLLAERNPGRLANQLGDQQQRVQTISSNPIPVIAIIMAQMRVARSSLYPVESANISQTKLLTELSGHPS